MLNEFISIFYSKIVISAFLSWLIAQVIKAITSIRKKEKILFFGYGNMPSSHISTMSALSFSIFLYDGASTPFIISSVLTLLIIRDATGSRREIGKQAKILNKILEKKTLKESTGHSYPEVIVGAIIGILISILVYLF